MSSALAPTIARRRSVAIVAAVALFGAACGEDGASAVASDVCTDEVRPTLQEGSHLIGDTAPPVPYSSTPPTSGWHKSGAPRLGVIPADDPLSDPEIVSALEVGDVVVTYDPARTPDTTVARLEELAQGSYGGQVTVTAYAGSEAPLTLTGWGVLRGCDELDEDALADFVSTHGGAGLEH